MKRIRLSIEKSWNVLLFSKERERETKGSLLAAAGSQPLTDLVITQLGFVERASASPLNQKTFFFLSSPQGASASRERSILLNKGRLFRRK